jgi:hypothetical protein
MHFEIARVRRFIRKFTREIDQELEEPRHV